MTEFYYNTTLEQFFKDWYPHDTDSTDYVQLLRSMNDDNSINKLVKKHDKLLDKIQSFQYRLSTKPNDWYRYDYYNDSMLWVELDFFLNKQIERVFNGYNEITEDMQLQCLVNLKPAMNRNAIIQNILPKCSEPVRNVYEELKTSIKYKEETLKILSQYDIGTNGYKTNKLSYIQSMKKLIKKGYIKDSRDSAFENNVGIGYFPDLSSKIKSIVLIIVIIPIVVLLIYVIGKVFIFVLCLLALLSLVGKGK